MPRLVDKNHAENLDPGPSDGADQDSQKGPNPAPVLTIRNIKRGRDHCTHAQYAPRPENQQQQRNAKALQVSDGRAFLFAIENSECYAPRRVNIEQQ